MSSMPPFALRDDHDKLCQVCGADAHGIHFQVISCRACAAFFRRSADCAHRYKCRGETHDCDVSKNAPHNCRLCRYQRCVSVGMNMEGIKSKSEKEEAPPSVDSSHWSSEGSQPPQGFVEIDGEQVPIEDLPDVQLQGYELKYDVDGQIGKITQIMDQPYWPRGYYETPMQALLRGYEEMLPGGIPRARLEHEVNFHIYIYAMNRQMVRIAKWAMECQEFALLPLEDKRKMYMFFWNYVFAFERVARTVQSLKEEMPGPTFLFTDTIAVNILTFQFYFSQLEDKGRSWHNELMKHFKAFNELTASNFVVPNKLLNMTSFETVYMCLYCMWNVKKIPDLSPSTYKIADKVLNQASDELHEYYVSELRTTNYVSRLSKMFKLMSGLESVYRSRSETMLTADMVKLFKCNLDDSELLANHRL